MVGLIMVTAHTILMIPAMPPSLHRSLHQQAKNFGSENGKIGKKRSALVISANSKLNTFGGFPELRAETTRPYCGCEAVECVPRCETTTDPRTTQGK